jgi:hypothetical protein
MILDGLCRYLLKCVHKSLASTTSPGPMGDGLNVKGISGPLVMPSPLHSLGHKPKEKDETGTLMSGECNWNMTWSRQVSTSITIQTGSTETRNIRLVRFVSKVTSEQQQANVSSCIHGQRSMGYSHQSTSGTTANQHKYPHDRPCRTLRLRCGRQF